MPKKMVTYSVETVKKAESERSDETLDHVVAVEAVGGGEGVADEGEAGHCVDPDDDDAEKGYEEERVAVLGD